MRIGQPKLADSVIWVRKSPTFFKIFADEMGENLTTVSIGPWVKKLKLSGFNIYSFCITFTMLIWVGIEIGFCWVIL